MAGQTNAKGTILVTGGAGFIGSHTCVELLNVGYGVVVIDNLVNSNAESLKRVEQITGKKLAFYEADVRDETALARIFDEHPITAAIHFAALKSVGESVAKPLEYYRNNIDSLLVLLDTMRARNVKKFVFSSSATVYGVPKSVPIDESFPLSATNPYGQSKLIAEQVLRDLELADPSWRIATLRYFNPVGAHESGLIGEDPAGVPNNLMPYVAQVAVEQTGTPAYFRQRLRDSRRHRRARLHSRGRSGAWSYQGARCAGSTRQQLCREPGHGPGV